ncbi:MAG: HU family DNA-binding protein [Pirellulaceae bacterium]|jgi:nucleoid DNA-binding protein|nr:HU family DNA-binding protein [Pirellulaceae bacterium]
MSKKAAGPKAPSKTEILNNISESTGLSKKDVAAVFDALTQEISNNISKKGSPGMFAIPGLCKIVVKQKPALPKRQVRKPGTNEMVWADARPASRAVRIRPLKGLKDMVS